MYEWSDIRTFLAVMRAGSAAAAARDLATNQTTISRRIGRLETALGLRLFEPGPRGARPTDAARQLRPEAEAMDAAAQAIETRAAGLGRRVSGTIRLTANPTAMRYGAGLVSRFQARHPDMRFEIDTETRTLSLEDGEADVALRPGIRLAGDTLIARKLFDHPWGFYAGPGYVARHGRPTSFADLARHQVICCHGRAQQIEPIATAHARLPPHEERIHVESMDAVIGLIRAGEGVGFLARAEGDSEPGLTYCFSEPDLVQGLWLVASPAAYERAEVRAFLRFVPQALSALLRDLPPEWRV